MVAASLPLFTAFRHPGTVRQPPSHRICLPFVMRAAPAPFHRSAQNTAFHIRMGGQAGSAATFRPLVRSKSAGWLANTLNLCAATACQTFTTLTSCGGPSNTLQFNDFRAFTGFLRNVVAGHFTASTLSDAIWLTTSPLRSSPDGQGNHRDLRFGLPSSRRVTYCIRIGRLISSILVPRTVNPS